MRASLVTAGERVGIESQLPWVDDLIEESAPGELRHGDAENPSIRVSVESDRRAFDVRGWAALTRGAWHRAGQVVLRDPCTAGFDLLVTIDDGCPSLTFRWRPPRRSRAAAWALRSRFHLLARAVLVQFPALWWAGTRDRAPLHASACTAGRATPLLAGPGGVGKSTLLKWELDRGGRSVGDNVCVGDGTTVWGLVEPLRLEGGSGRHMPHGRREAPLDGREPAQVPDRIVVVRRGTGDQPELRRCDAAAAARWLVAGTYMAGELRRFWSFAATLSAGTGVGPPHPPVAETASIFAARLPSVELVLGARPGAPLSELLQTLETEEWIRT
jgi:hypothetical protein